MHQQEQRSGAALLRPVVLALAAVLIAAAGLSAQSRIDITTLQVRYRTQKRIKKPSGDLLAALQQLEREAVTFYSSGKTGEVRRLLARGLTLLSGQEWNPQADFLHSLVLRTDRTVGDAAGPLIARVGQIYPSNYDKIASLKLRVSLARAIWQRRVMRAGKTLKEMGVYPRLPADLLDTPFAFEVDISGVDEGVYGLSAEFIEGDTVLHTLTTPLYVTRGLSEKRLDFSKRLAALSGSQGTRASIRYPFQLADLINLGRLQPRASYDWASMLQEAESLLESLEGGEDPLRGAVGDSRRHYYFEEADEIIPYRLYVPSSYDGSKPLPLIVVLHGLGGTESTFFDRGRGLFPSLCERHGYILVAPMGYRVNGGYGRGKNSRLPERSRLSELSEKDVMNVIALVRDEYRIDDRRIYLTGHSMGGNGTWHLATEYPDLWAAIAPCAAGSVTPDNLDVSTIGHLPVMVIHGDADVTAPVTASRRMVARMKELGMNYVYLEVAGGTHNNVVNPNLPRIVEFFDKHRKP